MILYFVAAISKKDGNMNFTNTIVERDTTVSTSSDFDELLETVQSLIESDYGPVSGVVITNFQRLESPE